MNAKEKAHDLIDKFIPYSYDGYNSAEDYAIQCARICVQECIDCSRGRYGDRLTMQYWLDVELHINKIDNYEN